jgi:ribosomal protein S27AE
MWVYNNAVAARGELMRRGLNAIPPELLEPPACPNCGGAVEHIAVGYSRVRCESCGYTQQSVAATATDLGSLGLGVLLGLGLTALLSNLAEDDKPAPRRRSTRRR